MDDFLAFVYMANTRRARGGRRTRRTRTARRGGRKTVTRKVAGGKRGEMRRRFRARRGGTMKGLSHERLISGEPGSKLTQGNTVAGAGKITIPASSKSSTPRRIGGAVQANTAPTSKGSRFNSNQVHSLWCNTGACRAISAAQNRLRANRPAGSSNT